MNERQSYEKEDPIKKETVRTPLKMFKKGFCDGSRLIRLFVTIGIFLFFFSFSLVPTGSMSHTIEPNDLVIFKRTDKVETGDVVLFPNPENSKELFVKRLIASDGDVLELKEGVVYVNEKEIDEPYVREAWSDSIHKFTVPSGKAFVMGDNRNHSYDSRNFGLIDLKEVKGKGLFVMLPFHRIRTIQ